MELLFTKNSYSHGRGIEKANQIHAIQKPQQQTGKVKAVKDIGGAGPEGRSCFLPEGLNSSEPSG